MKEEVRRYLEKANHALKVAEKLVADGFPSDAASKLYYAIFYAAQALLKSEQIDVIKHSAVESAVGHYFAKTGKIDTRFHRIIIDARKVRELADYDIDDEIPESVATLKIKEGKEFLAEVASILKNNE